MWSAVWFVINLLGIVAGAQGDISDTKFYLYTRNNKTGQQMQWNASSILRSGFNPNVQTKIIIPGWKETIESPMTTGVKNAFLASNDYNVISVDWTIYSLNKNYLVSRESVQKVGNSVARFVTFLDQEGLLPCKEAHMIGFSLGAHVAGNAGKALQKTCVKVDRITGLDPAGPSFFFSSGDRLASTDAGIVDVIHTNAEKLGIDIVVGTVDFWVNGGRIQPGCYWDLTGACSHGRSWMYFVESILDIHAFTYAVPYPTSGWASFARMGNWLLFRKPGSYSIETADKSPYSLV